MNTKQNNSVKQESSFLPSLGEPVPICREVGGGFLKISDFTYDLPDSKIAKYPLAERDRSKLLVWKNGAIKESVFKDCVDYIPENTQLIFNNTRVIHARMFFWKETGSKIEIFCLEPVEPFDYQIAFQEKKSNFGRKKPHNSKIHFTLNSVGTNLYRLPKS